MTNELLQEALRHARICRTFGEGTDEHKWLAELGREVERLERQNATLLQAIEAKQAKIDALMLEFCPGEMSAEQRAEWEKHQRPSAEPRDEPYACQFCGATFRKPDTRNVHESGCKHVNRGANP